MEAGPIGIILLVLSKAKFLLLGLSKASTFLTMLLSFGLYWELWGWKFALGFVLCIYIHEMGHVAALTRYGIHASAPMFIPGFGAMVRSAQYPQTVGADARVGLAGPLYGLGASIVCAILAFSTGAPIWAALARSSAWLNLVNLAPLLFLDGARGFRALTKVHRFIVAATFGLMYFVTGDTVVMILGAISAFRGFSKDSPLEPDNSALQLFIFLIVTLSLLSMIPVPGVSSGIGL